MKNISINSFRCFSRLDVTFRPGVNLFVGDNASGKTSLLSACKYVISSFFSGFSTSDTKWLSPKECDFMHLEYAGVVADDLPISISFVCNTDILPPLSNREVVKPFDLDKVQVIRKNSAKNSRPLLSGLRDVKNYAESLQLCYLVVDAVSNVQYHLKPLPLFVSYSTEDIHTSRKIDLDRFCRYAQKRSFGYYLCLEADGLMKYWMKRLLVLKEAGQMYDEEILVVKNAIISVLGPDGCDIIYDMQVRPNVGKVFFTLKDGREVESDLLSDGYKRLVSIVVDMAERCSILNRPVFDADALRKTKGVVILDEIDLHLHPSLQSRIVDSLRRTFSGVQFIMSTHSPMVMSGVRNDEDTVVYRMFYNESKRVYEVQEVYPYGMDISSIAKHILGLPDRTLNVQIQLDKLMQEIDNENYDNAKLLLEQLTQELSPDIKELIEARTIINLESE